MKKKKKVAVIGLGYVGLPLLLAIQKSGQYNSVGFDINKSKVKQIQKGILPITDEQAEKDLKEMTPDVSSDEKILKDSDIFIIAVPTPVINGHTPDYTPVIEASKLSAKYMKKGCTVILESTVNPGTSHEIVLPVLLEGSGLKERDFNLAHCPERINPGDPKWTVYNINRNVGSLHKKRNKDVANFYRSFIDAEINEVSSLKVAEATKIVENTFRDINIAFVNELAKSFDAMDIDLHETLQGAANKPFAFLPHWPGAGVGGHCIAVDPYYLIKRAEQANFNHRFLKEARLINNSMPSYTISRLVIGLNKVGLPAQGTKIAMLGMSYKPNVADLRESPAFHIKKGLEDMGVDLSIFDPHATKYNTHKTLKGALKGAKGILLVTAHREFIALNGKELKKAGVKVVIDGRNALDRESIKQGGLVYLGIGRS